MQVYKTFFKIIKKNASQLSIYIVIFILFTGILGNTSENPANMDFEETEVNIAFINKDEDSEIIDGLRNYLEQSTNIKDVGTTKEELQEALYFREVEYVVTIPKGFTEKILNNTENISIQKTAVPNSISEVYIDNIVNRYINNLTRYTSSFDNISEPELVENVKKDLDYSTKVEVINDEKGYLSGVGCGNYYNFMAYSLFAILTLGVSVVMLRFDKKDLKMRHLASSLTKRKYNLQLVLGNFTFAVIVWFLMVLLSFAMHKEYMLTRNGGLFLLNSFIFSMAALSIGLFASNFIKNGNTASGVANVVALGSCFISGVFVPQQFLGDTVTSIAKFNPVYWYVKANDQIAVLVNFNKENLMPIINNMLIVLGFAVTIMAITLVAMKQKRVSE